MTIDVLDKANQIQNQIIKIEEILSYLLNSNGNIKAQKITLRFDTEVTTGSWRFMPCNDEIKTMLINFYQDKIAQLKKELEAL